MFDQFQNMFSTPQTREMVFNMMAGQMSQMRKERREALARVKVTLERTARGMNLSVSQPDDPQIEEIVKGALETWG